MRTNHCQRIVRYCQVNILSIPCPTMSVELRAVDLIQSLSVSSNSYVGAKNITLGSRTIALLLRPKKLLVIRDYYACKKGPKILFTECKICFAKMPSKEIPCVDPFTLHLQTIDVIKLHGL